MRPMFLSAALLTSAATAQPVRLAPIVDARLRWESVDEDGVAREANAVTVRLRTGLTATHGRWQGLVESEGTLRIAGRYDSGTNGVVGRPLIGDAQNIELNRAQLGYAGVGWSATVGRQRIELADARFVGSGPFRQNDQTFDAARVRWGNERTLFTDVTYAWSDRTTVGIEGRGARQQAVSGDNVFALAGAKTPIGMLTGFAYLVDQDEAAVQNYQFSSQSYGVRLTGTMRLDRRTSLGYAASWARQRDWHRNPNRYTADYWIAEASATRGVATVTVGHEVLGADDGRPLTSFQTPLASRFKFQGWTDRFATTPPTGLRDLYAGAGVAWKQVDGLGDVGLVANYHRFRSDRLDQHYGSSWNMLATLKRGRTLWSVRYADYKARSFATDISKLWLQLDWIY
jgi:hypothetical protein